MYMAKLETVSSSLTVSCWNFSFSLEQPKLLLLPMPVCHTRTLTSLSTDPSSLIRAGIVNPGKKQYLTTHSMRTSPRGGPIVASSSSMAYSLVGSSPSNRRPGRSRFLSQKYVGRRGCQKKRAVHSRKCCASYMNGNRRVRMRMQFTISAFFFS